jgi:hypothetical protein
MALLPYQILRKSASGSEVIRGGQTHRQAGDLISLLSFLESRLIIIGSYKIALTRISILQRQSSFCRKQYVLLPLTSLKMCCLYREYSITYESCIIKSHIHETIRNFDEK